MSFEYWYATSSEGKAVRYGYKELTDGIAAISATVDGQTMMILQNNVRAPMTREEVEKVFQGAHLAQSSPGRVPRSAESEASRAAC